MINNRKMKSTDPMLDDWVEGCKNITWNKHLLSVEDEETIMKIANKLKHRSK